MNCLLSVSDYQITLNMHDIFLSLLYIALIILVCVIIATLIRVYQSMTLTMKMVKKNSDNIGSILSNVDNISKNADTISGEVAHATSSMRPTVDNIADTAQDVTRTIKENNPVNEAIITAYKTVNGANKFVSSVKDFTDKKKDKKKED